MVKTKKVVLSRKKKPRVLILYDFPIRGGGSGVYVKYLALRLKEKYKYDVAVALPDKEVIDAKIKQFYVNLPQIPVYISRPGLKNSKRYSELSEAEIASLYCSFIEETIKIVEKFHPDVIHVHHALVNAWVARFIRSLYDVKFVITSHGSCLDVIFRDRRYFKMTKDALVAAQSITVVSGDSRDKLLKIFGKSLRQKVRITPGGVRLSFFPEKKNKKDLEQIRKKYKLPAEQFVLFAGRLINEKGVDYLVKAADKILGEIVIVGDGPQKKKIERLIKEEKIKNVTLIGYVEHRDLIDIYYLASIFVSPSVWDDPMPLGIIEAMAAGLPVVVTRKGGIPLAVKDNYSGFFVRPKNANDIADKVNLLLKDKKIRKVVGRQAREVVINKFTWTRVAEKFDKIYTRI